MDTSPRSPEQLRRQNLPPKIPVETKQLDDALLEGPFPWTTDEEEITQTLNREIKEKNAAEIANRMAKKLAAFETPTEKPLSNEIENLERTLASLQAQRKKVFFFQPSAKLLDKSIFETQTALEKKKKERTATVQNLIFENIKPLLKTVQRQIEEKKAELASLSAWQVLTWPRQAQLKSEITALRKRQITEALISQNLLEKKK